LDRENEYCKNMRFLGIDYDGYPLLYFELTNGKKVMTRPIWQLIFKSPLYLLKTKVINLI